MYKKLITKILLAIFSILLFLYIVLYTEPPKSWPQASLFQILSFFISLLLFLTFIINTLINYLPKSFSLSLGLMFLLVLQATDNLTPLTLILTLIIALAVSIYFKKIRTRHPTNKPKLGHFGLTKEDKNPTLSPLRRFKK